MNAYTTLSSNFGLAQNWFLLLRVTIEVITVKHTFVSMSLSFNWLSRWMPVTSFLNAALPLEWVLTVLLHRSKCGATWWKRKRVRAVGVDCICGGGVGVGAPPAALYSSMTTVDLGSLPFFVLFCFFSISYVLKCNYLITSQWKSP